MVVNQVGYQVTDFAIQTQMGTSAITAFAQQAPQAIGAITALGQGFKFTWSAAVGAGTAIGVFATAAAVGLQMAAREWDAMRAAQDKAKKSAEDYKKSLEFMNQQQALLEQQKRMEFITGFYRDQTEFLERQVAALERINELRAAQGGAEAARAAAAVTLAQNTGGNVLGARADAAAVGINNQADELEGRLASAVAATAVAVQALETANAVAAEQRNLGDQYSEDAIASREAVRLAEQALATARDDEEKQRGLFEFARQSLAANVEAELSTLSTEAQAAATKSAEETRAAIEQKIAEAGGNVSSTLRDSLATLNKILEDSTVKPAEMAQFVDALNRVRISNESKDEKILSGLTSMVTAAETILNRLPEVDRRIDGIMARLEQLEARP
jgi:hypothetical protein